MAKASSETRAAIAELVSELDRTRKEFARATVQATQQETQLQQMRDADVKKDQLIAHLEAEMSRKDHLHKEEVELLRDEFKAKDDAWGFKVDHLELEVKRLAEENAAIANFEKENRQLRDSLLECQSVIERLQLTNDDLKSRLADGSHDRATALEESFNKRLADAEKKFRAEAYRALSEEAKLALQGNDHLQTVLRRQNDSIEAVLSKCKQLEQAHAKVCDEQEASQQNLNQHLTELQRLRKQLGDARSKNVQLEESLKQRKLERASLELLYIEYEATRKQLLKVSEKSRRAVRESERWKNRAIQLSHELTGEQLDVAEARIQSIQQRSEKIEVHLQKQRVRSMRRDKKNTAIAEGAANLRMTEQQPWSGDDSGPAEGDRGDNAVGDEYSDMDDVEITGDDVAAEARKVNPMEILSMWNRNFEAWRPGGGSKSITAGDDTATTMAVGQQHPTPRAAAGVTQDASSAVPARLPPVPPHDSTVASTSPRKATIVTTEGRGQQQHPSIAGGEASLPLAPVRPHHHQQQQRRVDDVRRELDSHLSVLSKPRYSALSSSAKLFSSSKRGDSGGSSSAPKMSLSFDSLSVVTHGEFQRLKRQVHEAQRFLAP